MVILEGIIKMLYSEQMKLIIDKFGLDPSTLPDNLYSTLLDAIYKLDVGSGGGKPTQTKNVTIDENGTTNIVPDSGYTLSQVTVNVDVEDTPTQVKSIDVTENGTTEVTPDSGYALSKVTVNTNVATSGGGESDIDALINRSITEISSTVSTIGHGAFKECQKLAHIDFPNATTIDSYAFQGADALTNVVFPKVETIYSNAFYECSKLTSIDFPTAKTINVNAIRSCSKLTALIIRTVGTCCTLAGSAFSTTPIANKTGYIYVPSALVEEYKSATNWSNFATQFRALEDYTVDGTITGALDESKI